MTTPIIRQPAEWHPLVFLAELCRDAFASLSVPEKCGRWNLHRWDGAR